MKYIGREYVLFGLLFLSIGIPEVFGFSVFPENDPDILTNNILGTGITVVNSPTFTGDSESRHFF